MKAAIYTRVSTRKQDEDGTSLQTQLAKCREYAFQHGLIVDPDLVFQEVHTGAELWDRPLLTRLRQRVRERAIDVVIAYAIDRLTRDPVHLGVIVSEAEYARVAVEFVTEPLDDTPEGQLVRFVRGYAARVEREKARERTLRGKRARVENGKVHSHGSELFGYRRDKQLGRRLAFEPEARVVRLVYRLVADGASIKSVLKRLNEDGIPAPSKGKLEFRDGRVARWGNGMVHRLLRNPAYVGDTVEWKHKRIDSVGRSVIRDESEWVQLPEGTTPALVSREDWTAVQERLSANASAAATRNADRPYLLRGLIRCSLCGRSMRSCPEKGRRTYRCSSRETPSGPCGGKRVSSDSIEAWVWSQVESILSDDSIIAKELERQRTLGPDAGLVANREASRLLVDRLTLQQDRLARKLADLLIEDFPTELIEREIVRLESERKAAQRELERSEVQLLQHEQRILRLDDLSAYCGSVRRNLITLGFEERRMAVEALVESVRANGNNPTDWEVTISIPSPLEGNPFNSSTRCGSRRRRSPLPA